jgi:putative peptide zinc metalloprotease protein
MYTRDTFVEVQPFSQQREGDDIIIGRIEAGVFLAVPPEAVELLENLAKGKSVGETADLFQKRHGEVPDLDDFLGLLETKGIVAPLVEGRARAKEAASPTKQPRKVRYHFTNFSQSLAQRIFSRPVLLSCLLLALAAFGLVIYDPSLAPRPRDLYFPDHRTMIWIILIILGYTAVFVHELGHLIAARALGINSRMGISHRLWHVVAETDLTGLWSVPKQQRYLPLFAGAIIDVVSGSLLVFLLFAHSRNWVALPILAVRLARAMAFTYVMRIIWQCLLFIRTDFYYVIASLFNCRSLLSDTESFLRNLVSRILPWVRPVDQSAIPAAERRVIRVYAVLWVLGRIAALFLLSAVTIPLFIRYSRSLGGAVKAGYSANPSNFIDALVFTFYFLMPVTLGVTLWIRSLVRNERT